MDRNTCTMSDCPEKPDEEHCHTQKMTASISPLDEPDSHDQENEFQTPHTQKPVLMIDGIDSATTSLTSPASSRKSPSSSKKSYSMEKMISFNDNLHIIEVDCDYTEEQTRHLWFTKTEYDQFLQACDEDAQKCEAREKEMRVTKIKREIRKQRRQRRMEEKERENHDHTNKAGPETDHIDLDMDDEIADDSLDGEKIQSADSDGRKENDEGKLCSLGLEAWTLEGYQTREHHRQKSIDAVLNEQFAAWDRGMVENTEMMSALYFAASAISKHSAAKKGKDLEEDVKEYMVVSTLEDYNRAVQALNVLQKSLHCIRNKRHVPKSSTKANRRGSNESLRMTRRGSNERTKLNRRGSNESTSSIDRTLAVTDAANDVAPRPPKNNLTEGELVLKRGTSNKSFGSAPSASNAMKRKKSKPRSSRASGTPHNIYKSKASTNIIVAPPTPPVVKAGKVSLKPGVPRPGLLEPPMTRTDYGPKNRKTTNKPSTGGSSKEESLSSMRSSKSSKTEPKDKARKSKKRTKSPSRRKITSVSPGPMGGKGRSLSPDLMGDKNTGNSQGRSRSRSPGETGDKKRDKSPARRRSPGETGDKKRDKSPARRRSPGRVGDNTSRRKHRSTSPRSSATPTTVVSKIPRKMKRVDINALPVESVMSTTDNLSSLSTHNSSRHESSKKEHWWFSREKQ